MARPQGQRCLVIASHRRTVSRTRSGSVLHAFHSALPGGSQATCASADTYTILDCIYHAADQTYYVLDMMCWSGYLLYDCSAEFRNFWVQSKLAEVGVSARGADEHIMVPVPAHPCTQGERALPSQHVNFYHACSPWSGQPARVDYG